MRPSDKPEFLSVLNGLAACKPGANKLTVEALDLWWHSMASWSIVEFKTAAVHLSKSVEFMPNPYHFEQLRKATAIGKHEAWEIAVKRCTQHIEHPSDRITRAAQMVGGYRAIGHTNTDQLPFLARRFMDAYEEAGESEHARAVLPSYGQADRIESSELMRRLEQGAA